MTGYSRRYWLLAACLSALAGFVDALGFIELGGFFVSFMSGNSTRLGVGLASAASEALMAASLIGIFVLGVVFGSLTGHFAHGKRALAVLGLVTLLLTASAIFASQGLIWPALACVALAMGAENAVFERNGEVSIGLTYMTGALVRMAQNITKALLGGPRFDWLPFLLLWCGLILGATGGAIAHAAVQLNALWIAAAVAAFLALAAHALHALDTNGVTK